MAWLYILLAVPFAVMGAAPADEWEPQWAPLFNGIDIARLQRQEPEHLSMHAVRIDLHVPGIEFVATSSNGERPLETDGQKTSTFLKQSGCQLAVNASPFTPVRGEEGEPRDILGLAVSRGDAYSGAHKKSGALLITRDNKAWFSLPPFNTEDAHTAVGGFGMLLKGGHVVCSSDKRHPRTAAGLSKDGRYLYLAVIDGRQVEHSVGATLPETAHLLQRLGAHDALNLDGGGSSTLAIADGSGGAKILNRPIHNHVSGHERVNGNNLGVFARPCFEREEN